MNKPLVSVIIPTHNRVLLLKLALDSVLGQTYNNLEVIVVDDASEQETKEFLQNCQKRDSRVLVVMNTQNKGFVRSLNKGIAQATGKYIARLDDDDSWCDARKLEKQISFLERHPEYALVGGSIIRVDEEGKEISRQHFPETDEAIRRTMLIADPFVHPAIVFRRHDIQELGGYDEQLDYAQDWDLWMRLGRFGKYYNFQDYFVRYLQSSQNRSNKKMRHHLWLNLVIRKRHKDKFSNFWKGYLFGLFSYLFSFLPIRYRIHPILIRVKRLIAR